MDEKGQMVESISERLEKGDFTVILIDMLTFNRGPFSLRKFENNLVHELLHVVYPYQGMFISPKDRLRSTATELLITTRYLDEGPDFYLKAQLCFDAAVKMNESLVDWLRAENYNDKWIVENAPNLREEFKGFKKLVASAREKILNVT